METVNLIERDSVLKPLTRPGFWHRQFGPQVTTPQIIFDIAFGIVGPILCFAFDPVVFRGGIAGGPLAAEYKVYVYLFSGLEILMLSFWLVGRKGFQRCNDLLGIMLVVAGIFCLAVGLGLMPFSLMGLIIGLGLFGFIPFLTAIVYLRNGARALQDPRADTNILSRVLTFVLGAGFVIGAPLLLGFAIHQFVQSSIDEIVHGDASRASAAAHRVAPLGYFVGVESNEVVTAYMQATDPARKQLLRNCYQEITGEDIEVRIRIMQD
jgi:hypothetical protein